MPFYDDLKRPFNLISTLLAVGSIVLSIYFWQDSEKRREPIYRVHRTTQIVDQRFPSKNFTVVDAQGKRIGESIYVVEISIWNAGRLPIDPADVRVPLTIALPANGRLLDYTLIGELKPAITAVKIGLLPPSADQKELPTLRVTWNHLDPGLGARFQLIYAGASEVVPRVDGEILDASLRDGTGPLERFGQAFILLLTIASAAATCLVGIYLGERLSRGRSQNRRLFAVMLCLVLLSSVVLVVNRLYLLPATAPI